MGYAAAAANYIVAFFWVHMGPIVAFHTGCYAEFATIKSSLLASIPDSMSFEEAAAVPLVSLTAIQVKHH